MNIRCDAASRRCLPSRPLAFSGDQAEQFAGRGLASRLVREALDDVRRTGKRIVPVCPYVKGFLEKHEEFADITDPATPDAVQWIEAQLE
ncbi:GNAT family N-acetyltransferase [Streptomyces spiralis]|uniref:GNAT family N-acetyltransferase n=1 Tax=Streptomyces spiralis TaxID=66376 RepID=UPI0036C87594